MRDFKWGELHSVDKPVYHEVMAKTYVVTTTCDMCGSEASNEVTLNGYQMDLCDEHAEPLRQYEGVGTRVSAGTRPSRGRSTASSADKAELARMREWAQANGYKVGDRGRISQEIRDAYKAAMG